MTAILRSLPFFAVDTQLVLNGAPIPIKAYQVFLWVSVTLDDVTEWDPRTPRLPALLDPGNNHNFSIQEQHLLGWAGIQPESLKRQGHIRDRGRRIPLHAASLWIHRNAPKSLEVLPDVPYCLELEEGIAVYPDDESNYPRLPLLGLRALTTNGLHLTLDGKRRRVSLRTAWGWWPFG